VENNKLRGIGSVKRRMLDNQGWFAAAFLFLLSLFNPAYVWPNSPSARLIVERDRIFLGEPFLVQIQIEGSESPSPPDLSHIENFTVEERGSQTNNRTSITIINGQVQQLVQRGYTFSYLFTPTRSGSLNIPELIIDVNGQKLTTLATTITVEEPKQSDDFKLEIRLSKEEAFLGEPLVLTVDWLIGLDVESFNFTLPILSDPRFDTVSLEPENLQPHMKDAMRISVNGEEVIAQRLRGRLNNREALLLRFRQIIIPRETGILKIAKAVVNCNALSGYQQQNRRHSIDPFFGDLLQDDFFFGQRRQAIYSRYTVPSNELSLTVLPLPEEGRPSDFYGLVGQYSIITNAIPTDVAVGEPITLTMQIAGPPYLGNVRAPALHRSKELTRDFRIPEEISPGRLEGGVVTFSQTLRAKHSSVSQIPAIRVPFFDPEHRRYRVAASEPISLNVKPTRVVTAKDAEGTALDHLPPAKSELEEWQRGIAHNYEDNDVLRWQPLYPSEHLPSWGWILIFLLPPMLYLSLLAKANWPLYHSRSGRLNSRKALSLCQRKLQELQNTQDITPKDLAGLMLGAFKEYLAAKLNLDAKTITFCDLEPKLRSRDVPLEQITKIAKVFSELEAVIYANTSFNKQEEIMAELKVLGEDLEELL
jgi:hypothetical protein